MSLNQEEKFEGVRSVPHSAQPGVPRGGVKGPLPSCAVFARPDLSSSQQDLEN